MAGSDDIADAGLQAFDDEHRQVPSPGERPDWEAAEEAEAGATEASGIADDSVAPGTQSPTNEPLGSDLGGPDAFGVGAADTDRSGGNWADAEDAGASDTGIDPGPESGRDDPFDGGRQGGAR
ncbi:hypothetical protein [Agrococcus baldri]|uniref:Uncharacterized protein n=1 Tax=Agrococcus baldri TaxID=153730 RepID=A0AA87RKH3_9MICO|nr:hypothetical protein [Agrococcus baldri]GEK79797.1 hypothetical protein ABA31_11480 [Agrococcus baldri]